MRELFQLLVAIHNNSKYYHINNQRIIEMQLNKNIISKNKLIKMKKMKKSLNDIKKMKMLIIQQHLSCKLLI